MRKEEKQMFIVGLVLVMIGLGVMLYGIIGVSVMGGLKEVEETYEVKAGDTMWGIAEKYCGVDSRGLYILEYKYELEKINPGVDVGALRVGERIKIRYYVEE